MITPINVPMKVTTSRVHLNAKVSESNVNIPAKINVAYNFTDKAYYTGETEVESRLYNSIILETKDKVMPSNVTVLPITILDVDNLAGGYTVTIGRF